MNAIRLPLDRTVKSTSWSIIDSTFNISSLCIVYSDWNQKQYFAGCSLFEQLLIFEFKRHGDRCKFAF
jgi:hypothetical protein